MLPAGTEHELAAARRDVLAHYALGEVGVALGSQSVGGLLLPCGAAYAAHLGRPKAMSRSARRSDRGRRRVLGRVLSRWRDRRLEVLVNGAAADA